MLSCSFSLPDSKSVEKYWNTGWGEPGSAGICWKRAIVAGVRNAVPLDATSFAAATISLPPIKRSNSAAYRFSAPGRLNLPAT